MCAGNKTLSVVTLNLKSKCYRYDNDSPSARKPKLTMRYFENYLLFESFAKDFSLEPIHKLVQVLRRGIIQRLADGMVSNDGT